MKAYKFFLIIFVVFNYQLAAQTTVQLKADRAFDRLKFAEALQFYKEIAQKEYKKANADYINLRIADCYRLTGKSIQAEEWYSKSINSEVSPDYYMYYADVLKLNGKIDESNQWISKYKTIAPEPKSKEPLLKEELDEFMYMASRYKVYPLPLNTPKAEYSPAFFLDTLLFVSSRDSSGRKSGWTNEAYYSLFKAIKDSLGKYSLVRELSSSFGTKYHEGPMSYSASDSILYFTRNNPQMGKKGKSNTEKRNLQILSVKYKNGKWIDFTELAFNNKEYSFGHPAISPDGKTLYFASDMPGGFGGTDIYKVHKKDLLWGIPENLGEIINSEGNEMFPFIADDGTLFYASDGLKGLGGLDVFRAEPDGASFLRPQNIGAPVNSFRDDFGFVTAPGKQSGYFSSNRIEEKGDDIYRFDYMRTPPTAVRDSFVLTKNSSEIPVKALVNDLVGERNNFTLVWAENQSANGSILQRNNQELSYTPKHDYTGIEYMTYAICDDLADPAACDTGTIVFNVLDNIYPFVGTTIKKGTKQLLDSVLVYLKKSDGTIIDSTYSNKNGNFYFQLIQDNDYTLTCSKLDYYELSDRISTYNLKTDTLKVVEELVMMPYALEGIVVYRNSSTPVEGVDVTLFDVKNPELGRSLTGKDGRFYFPLSDNHDYKVRLMKDNYLIRTAFFSTAGIRPQVVKMKELIEMDSMTIGQTIEIEIYFDLGKDNIRPDAAKTLDEEVVQLLMDNPGVSFEFGAHTDARGTAQSNQALSQRRATSAVNYIVSKGVEQERISGKGYGESKLKNHCKDGVSCAEKLHQENRRVEIVVTGINQAKQYKIKTDENEVKANIEIQK